MGSEMCIRDRAQGHSNFADAHREKGPHGLEAWRSGISSQSLQTTGWLHWPITEVPCSAPYGCLDSALQPTQKNWVAIRILFKVAHSCSKLHIITLFKVTNLGLGAGGWVLLCSTGLVLPGTTQNPARLDYGAACVASHRRATSPRFQSLGSNYLSNRWKPRGGGEEAGARFKNWIDWS